MISPPCLKAGDAVGIVAPARKISEKEIQPAVKIFQRWGLQVVLGKNLFLQYHQFAGTDTRRAEDMQYMLDHPEIRAVFCARGGYGTVRIVDRLDFSAFAREPKWIAGFSDITVLHAHIHQQWQTETLHALMPVNIKSGKKGITQSTALESLRKALFEGSIKYEISPHPLNRQGTASGILIGGNLSVLYSISGSPSDLDTGGKILFLEDLDEYLYHIDRMVVGLDRAGKFKNISGLIIGAMNKMRDNKIPFGKTPEEIIYETVKKYDFPVCFGFPAGHIDDNRTLILGRKVKLTVAESGVHLDFSSL